MRQPVEIEWRVPPGEDAHGLPLGQVLYVRFPLADGVQVHRRMTGEELALYEDEVAQFIFMNQPAVVETPAAVAPPLPEVVVEVPAEVLVELAAAELEAPPMPYGEG